MTDSKSTPPAKKAVEDKQYSPNCHIVGDEHGNFIKLQEKEFGNDTRVSISGPGTYTSEDGKEYPTYPKLVVKLVPVQNGGSAIFVGLDPGVTMAQPSTGEAYKLTPDAVTPFPKASYWENQNIVRDDFSNQNAVSKTIKVPQTTSIEIELTDAFAEAISRIHQSGMTSKASIYKKGTKSGRPVVG